MRARRKFTRDELVASHDYVRPQVEAGYQLHGGFLEDGRYVSPRLLHRRPAVDTWTNAVEAKGHALIDVSPELICRGEYPNARQQALLLDHGLKRTLWDALTLIGAVETRGGAMCYIPPLDFQAVVEEDLSETTTGHLHKGLFWAHGADEAGDPGNKHLGGHDKMWLACRDALLGAGAYPLREMPPTFGRPKDKTRELETIAPEYERLIKSLMNILALEVRAESFFAFCCEIFQTPNAATAPAGDAGLATTLVERIRADEQIHIDYLRATLSELRSMTFRLQDGGSATGAEFMDPLWAAILAWPDPEEAARDQVVRRERVRAEMDAVLDVSAARKLLDRFDQLADA